MIDPAKKESGNRLVLNLLKSNRYNASIDGVDLEAGALNSFDELDFLFLTSVKEEEVLEKLKSSEFKGNIFIQESLAEQLEQLDTNSYSLIKVIGRSWTDVNQFMKVRFLPTLHDDQVYDLEVDLVTEEGAKRALWQNTSMLAAAAPEEEEPKGMFSFLQNKLTFSLLIAFLLIAFAAGFTLIAKREKSVNVQNISKVEANIAEREAFEKEYEIISEVTKNFLMADTAEEVIPLVRDFPNKQEIITKYYANNSFKAAKKVTVKDMYPVDLYSRAFYIVNLMADKKVESLVLERMSNTEIKIDWQSSVGYSDYTFEELIEQRPTESFELRAYLMKDLFHVYEFSDESKYRCYQLKLIYGGKEELMYGYVDRESEAFTTLEKALEPDLFKRTKQTSVVLKCRYLEGQKMKNGFLIEEVISDTWIKP